MQNDFDYNTVPSAFLHCTFVQCLQANNCLRQKLITHLTPERQNIPIVNPARIPEKGEKCPYYFSDHKSQFALGITHLLDDIPHKKAIEIKRELFNYFKRTTYYRVVHQERLISPSEQKFIRQLFLNKGVDKEPLFDKYVEQYEW